MRSYGIVAFLGIALGSALGAALATSPTATADPIDEWPYGVASLPGFPDTGSITNQESQFVGLGTATQEDLNYLHFSPSDGPGDPWYSVHESSFNTPSILSNDSQQVTALLDASASYPSLGTTADQFEAFFLPFGGSTIPLITNNYLNDPALGFADEFKLFPLVDNLFISNPAGIQDLVFSSGQWSTLFEFPASDTTGGAASDLGGGFQQLLAELTGATPGLDSVLDPGSLF